MQSMRLIFWTVAMAYTGFLLVGQGLRTFNTLSITEAFLGALAGFFLATMFSLREKRQRRPALAAYSIEQIFRDLGYMPCKPRPTFEAKALIQTSEAALRVARAEASPREPSSQLALYHRRAL